jgi:cytochrome bd-type quinol oxidase subunit 2
MLSFLLIGIVLMSWPAAMAYPCPRYLNTIYPVIVLLMVGACFLLYQKQATKKYAQFLLVILSLFMIKGIILNRAQLHDGAAVRARVQKAVRSIFWDIHHLCTSNTLCCFLAHPFVSDIQSIFQTYLNDTNVQVAHEPMTTLAEQGTFSCNGPYRTHDVASRLETY